MQQLEKLDVNNKLDSNVALSTKYNNHLDYLDAYEQTTYFENQYNRSYQ